MECFLKCQSDFEQRALWMSRLHSKVWIQGQTFWTNPLSPGALQFKRVDKNMWKRHLLRELNGRLKYIVFTFSVTLFCHVKDASNSSCVAALFKCDVKLWKKKSLLYIRASSFSMLLCSRAVVHRRSPIYLGQKERLIFSPLKSIVLSERKYYNVYGECDACRRCSSLQPVCSSLGPH